MRHSRDASHGSDTGLRARIVSAARITPACKRDRCCGAGWIALTGYGQAHDRVLAKAAGFQHYFVKPVDMTALQRVLAEVAPTVHAS
jgi:CheY-like chemotaxis protein